MTAVMVVLGVVGAASVLGFMLLWAGLATASWLDAGS